MVKTIIILGLMCVIMLSAGCSSASDVKVPAEFTGHWKGKAFNVMTWLKQSHMPIDIEIKSDGNVIGTVGDAKLKNARFRRKNKLITKLFKHNTLYEINAKLSGPIVIAEGIKRDSIWLGLTPVIDNRKIEGGFHTSGWHIGGKNSMVLTGVKMELKRIDSNDVNSVGNYSKVSDVNNIELATQAFELQMAGKTRQAKKLLKKMAKANIKIRVGIYDSRAVAVAYAHSQWNEVASKMAEMEEAKAAGDVKKIKELEKWGKAHQAKLHRQGFSTAPVDDILEHIKDNLPQIAKEVNVVALVSKWDKKSLKRYKQAELLDVTDLIVAQFNPSWKQIKTIEQLKKKKPIPLWKLNIMMKFENH